MALVPLTIGALAAFAGTSMSERVARYATDTPSVVWTSRSGEGPFAEIRRMEFVSSGWLKWLFEPHRYFCEIKIEPNEEYGLRIALPDNMELTSVSYHPEWANRVRSSDVDFKWCRVRRKGRAVEIFLRPCACRRVIRLRLGIKELGWPFFGTSSRAEPQRFSCVD